MDYKKEFESYAVKHLNINSAHVNQFEGLVERQSTKMMTPYILEERQLNVAQMDVYSRLLMDRILFFNETFDSNTCGLLKAQLLFLASVDSNKDIHMYIDSGGGGVYAGLSLIDTMDLIIPDVSTTVTGIAASMGAVLLTSGTKGKRFALKRSRVMIHQPLGNPGYSQYSDLLINVKEMEKLRTELYDILADTSGQSFEQIEKWCDRDHWMTSEMSKERGFIDEILVKE